jgi:N-carbamoylputrescine amidase
MKIGLVQQASHLDLQRNLEASLHGIRAAVDRGAQLVVLQELHTSPYFCRYQDPQWFKIAEPLQGPTSNTLGTVAAELGVVIVGSIFEARAPGLYHNTAVVLGTDGKIAGVYRKMHIPDDPGYHEKYYFTPGDLGFHPVETSLGRLGVMICWDQWFPEAARLMALAGAQILIYPSAIGWEPEDEDAEQARQLEAWQTVQRGHAIANSLPVVCCNRVGLEDSRSSAGKFIRFWGSSFVCGPQGEWLGQAPVDKEAILVTEVDLGRTQILRDTWPFLRDRRVETYHEIATRYRDDAFMGDMTLTEP